MAEKTDLDGAEQRGTRGEEIREWARRREQGRTKGGGGGRGQEDGEKAQGRSVRSRKQGKAAGKDEKGARIRGKGAQAWKERKEVDNAAREEEHERGRGYQQEAGGGIGRQGRRKKEGAKQE